MRAIVLADTRGAKAWTPGMSQIAGSAIGKNETSVATVDLVMAKPLRIEERELDTGGRK